MLSPHSRPIIRASGPPARKGLTDVIHPLDRIAALYLAAWFFLGLSTLRKGHTAGLADQNSLTTELNIAGQPPVKPPGDAQSSVCMKTAWVMMLAFSTPTSRPLRS